MRCSNCGKELSEDTKFCSYCGEKVVEPEHISEDIVDDDFKANANDKGSLADKMKDKFLAFWCKLNLFEKICTIMLVIFGLLCAIAVIGGEIACVIWAILSALSVVIALLINKEIIKCQKKWVSFVALIVAVVMTIPYISVFKLDYSNAENFEWSEIALNEIIPETHNTFGEIMSNSEEYLSLYIYKTNEEKYDNYVEKCKANGFIIEAEETETSFYAYDDDGYKLSLYFYEDENKMNIEVDAPAAYGEFEWSNSEFAKLLPVPKSNLGEIVKDDETGYEVYVAETTTDEFDNYVSECKEKGFNIEVEELEKYFSAKNNEGYKFCVEYIGNKVVLIRVQEPEYNVEIEIECVENWIFSKYDVEIYMDDDYEDTLTHGSTETYSFVLTKGTYTIKFVSAENDELTGEVKVDIAKNEELKFKISCSSFGIDVECIGETVNSEEETENSNSEADTELPKITVTMGEDELKDLEKSDAENKLREMGFTTFKYDTIDVEASNLHNKVAAVEIKTWEFGKGDFSKGDTYESDAIVVLWIYEYKEPEKPSPVYYSTNDYETAKKGNTGVFSYKNKSGSYDVYWIINFDEGYVYWFTEGNEESSCDKVKIVSGDLNDKITVTWHDGGDEWSWYLHFKYINHPETLVVNDHNGFATEFTTTDLDDALELRDTKTIKEY